MAAGSPAEPPRMRPAETVALALLCATSLGASCGQTAITLLPGVVNDPGNRSLRRAIFGFATDKVCGEMKARSLPLKMGDADPAIGRFFPTGCSVTQLGNENLFVQFVGHGYGWSNVTGRMGFEAAASVEYDHDFLVDGSSLYVYFKQVQTQSSSFKPLMIEKQPGGLAGTALSLLGADMQTAAQQIGNGVLRTQLARGFTVVRDGDDEVEFSTGVLQKGAHPLEPFAKGNSDWPILVNDRTELHTGQRDYTGPYLVPDAKHALVLTVALEGAPAVDVIVVAQQAAQAWIAQYERYAETAAPPAAPVFDEAVAPMPNLSAPPPPWRRELPLYPGSYYIVFDHTATAGRTNPPAGGLDDRAALVSYAVQLGKR